MEELHQIARMNNAAIRTEITRAIAYQPAGQEDTGKLLRTDTYPRISLGILQQDIVSGLVLLNKIVF